VPLKNILPVILMIGGIALYFSNFDSPSKLEKNTVNINTKHSDTKHHTKFDDALQLPQNKKELGIKVLERKVEQKRGIHQNWCSASKDVIIEDRILIEDSMSDWDARIGKAYVGFRAEIHQDDFFYPDNYVLAPYQEMGLDELERSANLNDKWAMVTFIQMATYKEHKKALNFANELLIQGAVHHALEYLVKSELILAKSNLMKNDLNSASNNVANAIAYSILGLEEYSEGGLKAYLGIIERDKELKEIFQPLRFLKERSSLIKKTYNKVSLKLSDERESRSIFLEQAPDLVKKYFNTNLAAVTLNKEKELDLLNELNISNTLSKADTKCVDKLRDAMQSFVK
tara:strand:- start:216 stop:1244 length:1029 start_codon:yes stop_codon:yes gene_type:complete